MRQPHLLLIIHFSLIIILASCAIFPEPEFSETDWYAQIKATDIADLYAPNYDPQTKKFFNPWMQRADVPAFRMMFSKSSKLPQVNLSAYIQVPNNYDYLRDPDFESISFAGHAGFFIKMNGETVITDPLFSKRAAISNTKDKINIDYTKIPDGTVVLISHNHYDHLDVQSVKALIKKDATFLVPMNLKSLFKKWGAKKVHELHWWEDITIGDITYTLVPAQHWSMRGNKGNGSDKTLWGGWIISGDYTVYFSGDTGYFRGFEEFGNRWEIDYALIAAGAYHPRWFMSYQHTDPYEFIKAADDMRAKVSIPMHLGLWQGADDPIYYPLYVLEEFIKENPEYAAKIKLLRVGEYIELLNVDKGD